jgi:hypothetical protein
VKSIIREDNLAAKVHAAHRLTEAGQVNDAVSILGDRVLEGVRDSSRLYVVCLWADVLAEVGPSSQVKELLEEMTPHRHEFVLLNVFDYIGSIEYFIGRCLQAMGDLPSARAAYQRAVLANDAVGNVPWRRRAEQRLSSLEQLT